MEQIISREVIASAADKAAREYAQAPQGSPEPVNPYPCGSDAAAVWRAAFQRFLLLHSTGEVSA